MGEYYIFTFGCGQLFNGFAVKIKGNYNEARDKMIELYGSKWAFQYSEKEWESMKNDPNRIRPTERVIKVIE